MIVVKIEMWPYGDEDRKYDIGRGYIANTGGGDPERGEYNVAICRKGSDLDAVPSPVNPNGPKPSRAAHVSDYPRQAYNAWRLIARAILAAFPEEAKRCKRDEKTLLDEDVMNGLQLLSHYAPREFGAWPSSICPREHACINAARAWLEAVDR